VWFPLTGGQPALKPTRTPVASAGSWREALAARSYVARREARKMAVPETGDKQTGALARVKQAD
jgi:hypothetical protein